MKSYQTYTRFHKRLRKKFYLPIIATIYFQLNAGDFFFKVLNPPAASNVPIVFYLFNTKLHGHAVMGHDT